MGRQATRSSAALLRFMRWIRLDDHRALLPELHQSIEAGKAEVWCNVVYSRFPDKRRDVVLLHVRPTQHDCGKFSIKGAFLLRT